MSRGDYAAVRNHHLAFIVLMTSGQKGDMSTLNTLIRKRFSILGFRFISKINNFTG